VARSQRQDIDCLAEMPIEEAHDRDRRVIAPVFARVTISGVGHKNPPAQRAGIGRARPVRWLGACAVALGLMVAGCGVAGGAGADFPNPPRESPVTVVLVSADGRVLTGVGPVECGHDPRLVARSNPRTVTLIWLNLDTNCNAEVLQHAVARARLPVPLGNRRLVQASGGGPVRYFDERGLARVTVLPAGLRLSSEYPTEWTSTRFHQAVGDTRAYAGPPGTGTAGPGWPCSCAQLQIIQLAVSGRFAPLTQYTKVPPADVRVRGRAAVLLGEGSGQGSIYARSITWVEHGYQFWVGALNDPKKVRLGDAQLIAVADGIRLPTG
jgi:hypothetical protein